MGLVGDYKKWMFCEELPFPTLLIEISYTGTRGRSTLPTAAVALATMQKYTNLR